MFMPEILKNTDHLDWWKNQEFMLDKKHLVSGIETIFSTFGLVHSKLRNRLHIEKAAKLVFLYKLLNM